MFVRDSTQSQQQNPNRMSTAIQTEQNTEKRSNRTNVSDRAEKLNVVKQAVAKKMNSKKTKKERNGASERKESSKNNNRQKWCNTMAFPSLPTLSLARSISCLKWCFHVIHGCQRERDQEFVI